ncbi:MAG: hypothetical protein L0H03_21935 [Rhodococcus sp. (in: high G+C Gram-positive bacteria)]|uniref:hypothetical protein n=1 Tax=Rhodococcus erythropolis TaxID=1833 RepID=UPI00117B7D32|nr:hypothetical protein [Rhodococcus erythropolis]MDN5547922.1 hypothetical protein [Rhodococcus sp. (in: high G+C Gram-positive bacteria)]PBI91043.1 hypothetical protein BKP42_53950 [Rhodococcus erythropolis]
MGETKKSEGWLPPRTGGYVPARKSSSVTIGTAKARAKAIPPKGGGGVGNIHLKKREDQAS